MVATVFAVPLGAPASSADAPAEDVPSEELVNGTYGFEIDDSDIDKLQNISAKVIAAVLTAVIQDDDDTEGFTVPATAVQAVLDTLTGTTALKAYYALCLGADVPGLHLDDPVIERSFHAAAVLEISQSAAADGSTVTSVSFDAVIDASAGHTIAGTYNDDGTSGSLSAEVLAAVHGAFSGFVKLVGTEEGCVISQVTSEGAVSSEFRMITDVPLFESADYRPAEGAAPVRKNIDIRLNPEMYFNANTVAYGDADDGEVVLSLTAVNNFGEAFRSLSGLQIMSEGVFKVVGDVMKNVDIDGYTSDTEEFEPEDLEVLSLINIADTIADPAKFKQAVVDMVIDSDDPDAAENTQLLMSVLDILVPADFSLKMSASRADAVQDRADEIIGGCRTAIANIEHTVDVYAPSADAEGSFELVKSFKIKNGGSIPMDDPALAELRQAPEGGKFLGWALVDVETEEEDGTVTMEYDYEGILMTSKVFSSFSIVPIYATVVADESGIVGQGDFFIEIDEDGQFDYSTIGFSSNVTIGAGFTDTDDLIDDFWWNFRGGLEYTGSVPVTTTLKVEAVGSVVADANAGKDLSSSFMLKFDHEGALPVGTTVTVNVGDRYAAGTTFQVWHVDPVTNSMKLVCNSVAVDSAGAISIPLAHCSDYVVTEGSPVDSMFSSDGSQGGDMMIYAAVGAVALILVVAAVLLFRRHH